jgi:hypothetical protein
MYHTPFEQQLYSHVMQHPLHYPPPPPPPSYLSSYLHYKPPYVNEITPFNDFNYIYKKLETLDELYIDLSNKINYLDDKISAKKSDNDEDFETTIDGFKAFPSEGKNYSSVKSPDTILDDVKINTPTFITFNEPKEKMELNLIPTFDSFDKTNIEETNNFKLDFNKFQDFFKILLSIKDLTLEQTEQIKSLKEDFLKN